MRTTSWMNLLRGFALVALATSIALAVDYTSSTAAYCGQRGCAVVRRSISWFGINPIPWVGIAAFGGLFLLSLPASLGVRRKLLVPLALLGGALAAVLLLVQPLLIGELCPPCIIVDTAALAMAVSAWRFARTLRAVRTMPNAAAGQTRELERVVRTHETMRRWAWFTLFSLTVVAPLLWPLVRPAPALPAGMLALAQPGKVSVVEFSDFECQFCRELHPRLQALVRHYSDKAHFSRLNAPLASHPHAREAAHAAVCADLQSRGEAMADALFSAPVVSAAAARDLAARLGLDLALFDRCVRDPATHARVQGERALLDQTGLEGLPTVFIGSTKLVGAQPDAVLRNELDRAGPGETATKIPMPLFVGLLGIVMATVVVLGHPRRRARPAAHGEGSAPRVEQRPIGG